MTPNDIDSRHAGTLARQKLLLQALLGEDQVPTEFLAACRSQATFASLELPSHGVKALALNTLKASADICIERGGWQHLDDLRRRYMQSRKALRQATAFPGDSGMDAAAQLELERRFRVRLEVAYTDLLRKVAAAAIKDAGWAEVLQRHQAGFSLERLKLVSGDRSEG